MITKRQKEVLDFIKIYKKKKGYAPSLEEIKKHLGLSSVSTAHHHVKALENLGCLHREGNQPRAISISKKDVLINIPLLGTIAAGEPIEAIPQKESIAITKSELPIKGEFYALRVTGNSMVDENIDNGDIVIVKKQCTAYNGQKVVALIDNNFATLKKIYKEKNIIRLQPANKSIQPTIIKKDKLFTIQGIVVDIIKVRSVSSDSMPVKNTNNTKEPITKPISDFINKVIEGDCLEVMRRIPKKSIDMILCDLPYGTTQNEWDSTIPLNQLWQEYERIIKDNGAIVLTSQGLFTNRLISSNEKLFKYRVVWIKSKATNFLNAKKQPLRKHEDICMFYKKQPIYNPQMVKGEAYDKGYRKNQFTGSYGLFKTAHVKSDGERYPSDIVYFKTAESEGAVFHPTQKPVSLGRYLIRTFTDRGGIILDNACGSGSFLVSAVLEERNFIGIELNKNGVLHHQKKMDYIKICNDRLEKAKNQIAEKKKKLTLFNFDECHKTQQVILYMPTLA